ncbi:serpin E3 isoform X2 [Ranitomeya imitator]|uniref:serpin E3 isoform X2 n=1 Tax=Ranitomeya imitator TaxID=111125 RepID=UPI0037E7813B
MYTSKSPEEGDSQGDTSRGPHRTAHIVWFPVVHTYPMPPVLFWLLLYSCCLYQGHCHLYDRLRELNTEFAVNLYKTVVTTENSTNVVISPSSVATSLGLLQFGAQGSTFNQIEKTLGYNVYGGVKTLVPGGNFGSGYTQIALVSTMYYRSKWKTKFSFADTQTLPFISADGSVVKVPMMHQTVDVNYGQFETPSLKKFTVVELPYLGNTVSMFVVLPTDRNTHLASIESNLISKTIAMWANGMKRIRMDVFLPRFKLESYTDLRLLLPALGVSDLFDPRKADFKGISEQRSLYVSQASHKAEIEVEEGGTKGSGVSAMVLLKRSRMPMFKADRPFFFFLRQANSGLVLFIGRVTNPLH